jgi:outer membrane protein assembly factor BamB
MAWAGTTKVEPSGTLIEVDVSQPWSPMDAERGRGLSPPTRTVLLASLLILVLTGPALASPASLRSLWRLPVFVGFFWLTPDTVYTVDSAEDGESDAELWLTARDPDTGNPRWTVALDGPLARDYAGGHASMTSRFPPSSNLGITTRVFDTRDGRYVRAYPVAAAPLVHIGTDVAVVIDREPGTGPEPEPSGDAVGRIGLDRAHVVVARDLDTGAVRWTRRLAAGTAWAMPGVLTGAEGIVGLPPGQDWMLTVTRPGTALVWDLDTGALIAWREFGALTDRSYVTALADEVVVRIDTAKDSSLAGYDPATMVERWRFTPPNLHAAPFVCGRLVCLQTDRSVLRVDPHTGAVVSPEEDPRRPQVHQPPHRLLVTSSGEELSLYDTPLGRRLSRDSNWRVVDPSIHGARLIVAQARGQGRAMLAILDPATGAMRTLGRVSPFSPASQCLVAADLVACEEESVLQVLRVDPGSPVGT